MKKIIIALVVLLLAGCAAKVEKTTVIETDSGEQKVVVSGSAEQGGWCPAGGNWNMQATGSEGDTTASWKIDKLETSGKYAGLCHVVYKATTPQGEVLMDYWFDESGKNGYYEMNVNGQKISQEYHG